MSESMYYLQGAGAASAAAPSESTDLREYFNILRRYWRGIVAGMLLGIAIASLWAIFQTKVFGGNSSAVVVASSPGNPNLSMMADTLAKSKAGSYASLGNAKPVLEATEKHLGRSLASIKGTVLVTNPMNTAEIEITTRANSRQAAQDLAGAARQAVFDKFAELEQGNATSSSAGQDSGLQVQMIALADPEAAASPIFPNMRLVLPVGAILGLLLGFAYALMRHRLDRKVRSVEMVEAAIGVPVVGTIPQDDRLMDGRAIVEVAETNARSKSRESMAFSEAIRELRTNLRWIDVDNPPRTIVITSSVPGEGKSSISGNLAMAMAAAGNDVVIVDADLRRPVQAKLFGMVGNVGVTDVLAGEVSLEDALQGISATPRLRVLTSGQIPPNPSELLASHQMEELINKLAENATVIIDAPPLLPVTDASGLARIADGALLVALAGRTQIDEMSKAAANLRRVSARVHGVILNAVPTSGAAASHYGYYGHYYYYGSNDAPEAEKSGHRGEARRARGDSSRRRRSARSADPKIDA